MLLGYARVSKGEEQDTRMQEAALRAAGVERLFTERASGGRWDRPVLHRLLDQLRPRDVRGRLEIGSTVALPQGSPPSDGAHRPGGRRLSQLNGSD